MASQLNRNFHLETDGGTVYSPPKTFKECETNRVCLECKYCIYADLIKKEIDKKNEY